MEALAEETQLKVGVRRSVSAVSTDENCEEGEETMSILASVCAVIGNRN